MLSAPSQTNRHLILEHRKLSRFVTFTVSDISKAKADRITSYLKGSHSRGHFQDNARTGALLLLCPGRPFGWLIYPSERMPCSCNSKTTHPTLDEIKTGSHRRLASVKENYVSPQAGQGLRASNEIGLGFLNLGSSSG